MAPTEQARKNHDKLFPGHVSTLAVTDPELIETFDNFVFDEVLRHGNLDTRTRLMVQLASMIASQALHEYRVMLGAALNVGVTPIEVMEIVYQAVPYVGMAKVFDFIHATNDVLTERGVELPLPGQSTTTPENRAEKGLAVEKQIVGSDVVENLYASAPDDHYTRTGIDVPTRELLTFSMLVSLGGCEAQVNGHVAANVNVGNGRARLIDVLTQLLPFIGYPRTLNALRVVDEVTGEQTRRVSRQRAARRSHDHSTHDRAGRRRDRQHRTPRRRRSDPARSRIVRALVRAYFMETTASLCEAGTLIGQEFVGAN